MSPPSEMQREGRISAEELREVGGKPLHRRTMGMPGICTLMAGWQGEPRQPARSPRAEPRPASGAAVVGPSPPRRRRRRGPGRSKRPAADPVEPEPEIRRPGTIVKQDGQRNRSPVAPSHPRQRAVRQAAAAGRMANQRRTIVSICGRRPSDVVGHSTSGVARAGRRRAAARSQHGTFTAPGRTALSAPRGQAQRVEHGRTVAATEHGRDDHGAQPGKSRSAGGRGVPSSRNDHGMEKW